MLCLCLAETGGQSQTKWTFFLQLVVEGIKRGGWSTYCPAQRSWDGLVGGQVALEVLSSFHLPILTSAGAVLANNSALDAENI